MFFVLLANKESIDEVIFANTGAESENTYKTVELMKKLVEQKGILFTTVNSKLGNIYDYYFKRKGLPSIVHRDCTGKFKVASIRTYLRGKYGKKETFIQYIGISYEEAHRMRTSDVKYITNEYPLVYGRIDREKCNQINHINGFDTVAKSGCWFCPFTSKKGWIELMNNNPELYEKAVALEENCPNKKVLLSSKPLRTIREYKGQCKLKEFELTCDVAGGCFL